MKLPKRGEVLKEILGAFERRVEWEWIDPSKGAKRVGYEDESPPDYYSACIVPQYLLGKVVTILPEEEFRRMFKVFRRSKEARRLLKSTTIIQVDLRKAKQ